MRPIIRLATVFTLATGGLLTGCQGPDALEQEAERGGPEAKVAFTDVTGDAGLGGFLHATGAFGEKWFPETMGSGAGFIDYDGDGWQDVVIVGGGVWPERNDPAPPALELYRNNGDGTFTRRTGEAGLDRISTYGLGLAAADYDNDGDQDLFVSTLYENLLFRNDGGVFTEVGRPAGFAGEKEWSTSVLFFDADRDGWVDLYVGNYVVWGPDHDLWCTMDGATKSYCTPQAYVGLPGRYYHNNGNGTFTDQTETAGLLPSPGKTLGVAEMDFNEDGWSDLIVANDTERNLLFENNGDGSFTEKSVVSGVAFDENGKARAGMGIDAADVDNNGHTSIFIGHFATEMIGVFRYVGNGLFVDRAAVSRVGQASLMTLTFGLVLFDADLDGYLDLFAANGHIAEEVEKLQDGITYRQQQQLFMNQRDGRFVDVSGSLEGAFTDRIVARGVAYADYDRDGDLDLLLTENGGPVRLWRNEIINGRRRPGDVSFLRVRLEGAESNRDALGAQIVAVVGENRMTRRVRTGSSFLSQSELPITFGLDGASGLDSLLVYWPSGHTDAFAGLEANQQVWIREGTGKLQQEGAGQASRIADAQRSP